jgi:hypothetical protein
MPAKGQKITCPETLERLRICREKALETRKKNAAAKKEKQLLESIEKQKEQTLVKQKLAAAVAGQPTPSRAEATEEPKTKPEEPKPKPKPEEPKPKPKRDCLADLTESEESEPEVIVMKKPKKKKKIVYLEASSDDEPTVVKRKVNTRPLTPPQMDTRSEREKHVDYLYNKYYGGRNNMFM